MRNRCHVSGPKPEQITHCLYHFFVPSWLWGLFCFVFCLRIWGGGCCFGGFSLCLFCLYLWSEAISAHKPEINFFFKWPQNIITWHPGQIIAVLVSQRFSFPFYIEKNIFFKNYGYRKKYWLQLGQNTHLDVMFSASDENLPRSEGKWKKLGLQVPKIWS